jgi:hypothetical protein
MTTHVKVLTVLAFVTSIASLVGVIFASIKLGFLGAELRNQQDENSGIALAILGLSGIALVVKLIVFFVLNLLSGWGLQRRRRWGRILAIIVACISLIYFPIGSAVGAYALWVLFNKETEAMFPVRAKA